jgi:hypothetical protein
MITWHAAFSWFVHLFASLPDHPLENKDINMEQTGLISGMPVKIFLISEKMIIL